MKLIKPSFEILSKVDGLEMLKNIELAGRTCYKSEDRITEDSAEKFVTMLVRRGHLSVIEHEKVTVKIICDRGVSHELVRHRIASFSQESTRYCDYSKSDKESNKNITFIIPPWLDVEEGTYTIENWQEFIEDFKLKKWFYTEEGLLHYEFVPFRDNETAIWLSSMQDTERNYLHLLNNGWTPQEARSVLPNSLKTEVVITANLREWRLIFEQRTALAAHPQMREIMRPLLKEFKQLIPVVFDDLKGGFE